MRFFALACAALALSACGQERPAGPKACARVATETAAWSNPAAPDTITANAEGPACAHAALTLVISNANGEVLWTYVSDYQSMVTGGALPENPAPVSFDDMDRFLELWADVSLIRSGTLPQWREQAAVLEENAEAAIYRTNLGRAAYESLRARDVNLICYAAHVDVSQCLAIESALNGAAMIVSFGR